MNENQGRRSILKAAGILAAGAALMPATAASAPASESLVERLREDYRRRVAAFAARLRPEYARIDEASMKEDEVEAVARRLEDACQEEFCRTEDTARVVLAVSPHWDEDNWLLWHDMRKGMACAVAIDVAVAMRAEWYLRGALGIDRDEEVES